MVDYVIADTFAGSGGAAVNGRALTTSALGSVWEAGSAAALNGSGGVVFSGTSGGTIEATLHSAPEFYVASAISVSARIILPAGAPSAGGGSVEIPDAAAAWSRVSLRLSYLGDYGNDVYAQIQDQDGNVDPIFLLGESGGTTPAGTFDLNITLASEVLTFSVDGTVLHTQTGVHYIWVYDQDGVNEVPVAVVGGYTDVVARNFSASGTLIPMPPPPEPPIVAEWHMREDFNGSAGLLMNRTPNIVEGFTPGLAWDEVGTVGTWAATGALPEPGDLLDGSNKGWIVTGAGTCYEKGEAI
jgi:hypothetical protein